MGPESADKAASETALDVAKAHLPLAAAPVSRLVAVLILAFLLRLGVVISTGATPTSDAADYHQLALSLASRGTFATEDGTLTAFRAPGYPAVLALGYSLMVPTPRVGHLVNVFAGTITVAAVWILGCFLLGAQSGLWAAFLTALYPSLVLLPRVLISENLSVPLLVLCLGALTWCLNRRTAPRTYLLTGLLVGLAILVRSANVVPAALILLVMVSSVGAPTARERLRGLVWVSCGVGLCLAPWGLRNSIVLGTPVFLSTEGGVTLYSSYFPPEIGGKRIWGNVAEIPGRIGPSGARTDELERSDQFRDQLLERIRRDPWRPVRLAPEKVAYLLAPFNWEWFPHAPGRSRSLDWGYLALLLPAAFGVQVLWRARRSILVVLLVLPAASLLTALVFYGSPRFRLPADVSILLLAACGLQRIWSRLSEQ